MLQKTLSVGEVANRSGVTVSALHFYEAKGLIASSRNAGNQRRFAREVLRRVALIKVAQNLGFGLETIKEALDRLPKQESRASDWQVLSEQWRDELNERIDQLTRLRDTLTDCIGCGCLSISQCRLRNPGDHLAKQGSGPRLLVPD